MTEYGDIWSIAIKGDNSILTLDYCKGSERLELGIDCATILYSMGLSKDKGEELTKFLMSKYFPVPASTPIWVVEECDGWYDENECDVVNNFTNMAYRRSREDAANVAADLQATADAAGRNKEPKKEWCTYRVREGRLE